MPPPLRMNLRPRLAREATRALREVAAPIRASLVWRQDKHHADQSPEIVCFCEPNGNGPLGIAASVIPFRLGLAAAEGVGVGECRGRGQGRCPEARRWTRDDQPPQATWQA